MSDLGYIPIEFREGHHYRIDDTSGCWVWLKFKQYGYGKTTNRAGLTGTGYAHRESWAAVNGPIPQGYDVHHKCVNPACINPDHLEAIPPTLHRRRHRQADAPVTAEQVMEIRRRVYEGEQIAALAAEFGISRKAVHNHVNGLKWTNVDGPTEKPVRQCIAQGCERVVNGNRNRKYCSNACRSAEWARRNPEKNREVQERYKARKAAA